MERKVVTRSRSCGTGGRFTGHVRDRGQYQSVDVQPLLSSFDFSSIDVSLMRSVSDDVSCFSDDMDEMFVFGKRGNEEGLRDGRVLEMGGVHGTVQVEGWCADTSQVSF